MGLNKWAESGRVQEVVSMIVVPTDAIAIVDEEHSTVAASSRDHNLCRSGLNHENCHPILKKNCDNRVVDEDRCCVVEQQNDYLEGRQEPIESGFSGLPHGVALIESCCMRYPN